MKKIKVHIADPFPIQRIGFTLIIDSINNIEINGQSSSGLELIESIKNKESDVFVISNEIFKQSSLDIFTEINLHHFPIKSLILSSSYDLLLIKNIIIEGFDGFLHTNEVSEFIAQAIENVIKDEIYLSETTRQKFVSIQLDPDNVHEIDNEVLLSKILSTQQLKVLNLIQEDYEYSAKVIGQKLGGVNASSIRTQIGRIKEKLNIIGNSRIGLTKFAFARKTEK